MSTETTLTFATGPVHEDHEGRELRRRLADRLGDAMGTQTRIVAARSYTELASMMSRGDADLAWMSPAVYVRSESTGIRLVVAVERATGTGYHGVLFVPKNSPAHSIEDLVGTRVAWVDRDSCAGHLFLRLALRESGHDPSELFGEEAFLGSHGDAVRAVMRGDADAGATHAQLLDVETEAIGLAGWYPYAGRDGMRPILVSSAIPPDVICASKALDADRFDAAREALLHLHEADHGELVDEFFGGKRFVGAAPFRYDPVRVAMR